MEKRTTIKWVTKSSLNVKQNGCIWHIFLRRDTHIKLNLGALPQLEL